MGTERPNGTPPRVDRLSEEPSGLKQNRRFARPVMPRPDGGTTRTLPRCGFGDTQTEERDPP